MLGLESLIENMRVFKVLIAGERTPDRRDVRQLLQTLGFSNFREASDGDDALRKLRSQKINLTISEIRMPLVSGVEINAIIRKEKALINHPLLLLVSDSVEAQIAQEAEPALDGWINRPLHPQVLEDKVAEILFRRLEASSLDTHLQASGAALAKGQFVTAHQELDQAAAIDPNNPMVSYLRRMVYLAQGQNEKAEAAINQARQSFANRINLPKRVRKLFELGENRLDQGRWNEAQDAFDQAIEMALDKAKYKSLIGEAYLARGMADKAEAMFKASIEETPDDVHLYNRLGIAFRRQKKFAEAVSNYQKAISIDPFEENLRYNLARAYLAAGDRDNAAQALDKALEIMPDFKEAEKLLVRLNQTRVLTRAGQD